MKLVTSIAVVALLFPIVAFAGAAAALLVAGLEEWPTIADGMQAHTLMMITADGTIYTSPSMEQRIRWKQNIGHKSLAP